MKEVNLRGNERKKGMFQVAFLVFTLAYVAVLARPHRLRRPSYRVKHSKRNSIIPQSTTWVMV